MTARFRGRRRPAAATRQRAIRQRAVAVRRRPQPMPWMLRVVAVLVLALPGRWRRSRIDRRPNRPERRGVDRFLGTPPVGPAGEGDR